MASIAKRAALLVVTAFAAASCASLLGDFEMGGITPGNDAAGFEVGAGDGAPAADSASEVGVDAPPADGPTTGTYDVTALAAGAEHTCATVSYSATQKSVTYCWGKSDLGQLGGTGTGFVQVAVPPAQPLITLSSMASASHTCGLDAQGTGWCWGANSFGQLGNETRSDAGPASPVRPKLESRGSFFTASLVAVGAGHTCMLESDTTPPSLVCFGDNSKCQFPATDANGACSQTAGFGAVNARAGTTAITNQYGNIIRITAGSTNSGIVTPGVIIFGAMHKGFIWGDTSLNECGFNPGIVSNPTYSRPENDHPVMTSAMSVGNNYICTVQSDFNVYCSGRNDFGQNDPKTAGSMLGPTDAKLVPPFPNRPVDVFAGDGTTCATFEDTVDGGADAGAAQRFLACWGRNDRGQVGLDTAGQSADVTRVSSLTAVTLVAVGGKHTCAVARGPGSARPALFCWGDNTSGQVSGAAGPSPFVKPTLVALPPG
jgi:alpha-tubulin suppressor-like RCC1 family protein